MRLAHIALAAMLAGCAAHRQQYHNTGGPPGRVTAFVGYNGKETMICLYDTCLKKRFPYKPVDVQYMDNMVFVGFDTDGDGVADERIRFVYERAARAVHKRTTVEE